MKILTSALYQMKLWFGLMFVYPKLVLEHEDYDAYWQSKRGQDIGALSDWQIERANFVLRTLRSETGPLSFCDIACGDGSILNYISQHREISKLIGTDISEFALDQARKFGIETKVLNIGQVSELQNIPSADYEILFEILEHVPHSEALLKVAFAKAKRGVFFSFPNTGFFPHRFRLLFGRFPMQWKLFPGEHVRYWTKRDLLWWLQSLGLTEHRIHYYKGLSIMNLVWPSMFAAGFVVFVPKQYNVSTS